MKNFTLEITEVQFHYLKELAEQEVRSVEQLLYILLHKGAEWHYLESDSSLEVLPKDMDHHELEKYADPERVTVIRRAGHERLDGLSDTLNFKQQAIDPERTRQRDAERDLAAELIELADYHELLNKRRDEFNSKHCREWREFKEQQEAQAQDNEESKKYGELFDD